MSNLFYLMSVQNYVNQLVFIKDTNQNITLTYSSTLHKTLSNSLKKTLMIKLTLNDTWCLDKQPSTGILYLHLLPVFEFSGQNSFSYVGLKYKQILKYK